MFIDQNKQLKTKMLTCAAATLLLVGGCTDEAKQTTAMISRAIRSGIEQSNQGLYQRPDWKAEDYFTDSKVIELCQALRKRDLVLVDKVIVEGVDVNAKGKGNMTPLLWAFVQGRPWNKPPSLSQQNQPGFTEKWALGEFDAVHLAMFTKLLEHGADPNVRFTSNFFEASGQLNCDKPHASIAKTATYLEFPYFEVVMKNGGDSHLFFTNREKSAYVDFVVRMASNTMNRADSIKKLRMIIDTGVDLNQVDDEGRTPLMTDVIYGCYDTAVMLVEAGADWEMPRSDSIPTVLKILLEKGPASAEQTEPYRKLIKVLKEKGADFDEARAYIEFYNRESGRLFFAKSKEEREKIAHQIAEEFKRYREEQLKEQRETNE